MLQRWTRLPSNRARFEVVLHGKRTANTARVEEGEGLTKILAIEIDEGDEVLRVARQLLEARALDLRGRPRVSCEDDGKDEDDGAITDFGLGLRGRGRWR